MVVGAAVGVIRRILGRLAGAVGRNVVLALAVHVELAILALQALLEQALEQLATVVTHGRFRVRVDDERVRNFDPFGHGLLHPKRPSGAERVAARFLQTGTRASAGWADRQRPVDGRKTLVVVRDRIRRTARK